ncbi:hypothetical protein NDU88_004593 [Pleurodeles waltl]|uniref:Uncharacterized protein n=1 Tax=Pleurodeles waltl TaxID=8319 RepID=A0AAV7NJW3_PLEWA|nr:hypothetical protein NDU88_004593 [Pleurodeles waltl]
MAANRVRGGKRKGTDPDLAQLLKLVLAKLGGGDSEGEAAPSDGDDGEVRASRPRRANVAPPAAFPPVKRRNKKQTGETVVQQPTPQAVLTPPPPPVIELVTVVTPSIAAAAPSEEIAGHHAGVRSSSTGVAGGVEAMLADIRRSVAALAAPASDVPTQALPIAQGVAPGASAVTEQGQAARAHPGASQDLTTQTLASVSQMLANLTVPVPTPLPTTPWARDPLQNSVLELKRQVEALVAARNVPSLQVATSGPSVSQAPGPLSQTPPGGKEHGKVIEQGGNTIVTPAEVTGADTLLCRPGKLAAHVASEIKEKIWKGDFVDIFSLLQMKCCPSRAGEENSAFVISHDSVKRARTNQGSRTAREDSRISSAAACCTTPNYGSTASATGRRDVNRAMAMLSCLDGGESPRRAVGLNGAS